MDLNTQKLRARKVAKALILDHHEIMISEKEAAFFQKMVYYQDEPLADCVCVPLYYVSKLLKDSGITVGARGEGSDELYCGYQNYANHLKCIKILSARSFIPQVVKKSGSWLAAQLFPTKNIIWLFYNSGHQRSIFWSGAICIF